MTSTNPSTTARKTPDGGIKLAARLRRKAQAIAEKHSAQLWDPSPRNLIARQVALTLEELEQATTAGRRIHLGMLRAECELDTALMQPHDPAGRLRIQSQLLMLQTRRRELTLEAHQKTSELTHRLLDLVNRYIHVSPLEDRT